LKPPVHLSFDLFTAHDFMPLAKDIWAYQRQHNAVCHFFMEHLGQLLNEPSSPEQFTFLPIRFFKTHPVVCGKDIPADYFESSGTTGQIRSRHYIRDVQVYEQSFLRGFERQFGHPSSFCILGLLPSYLERSHSSLVYMVQRLMKDSAHPANAFYLHDHEGLSHQLQVLEEEKQPVILFGTTFALLDFAEGYSLPLSNTWIIETGGMKGRKEEIIREELMQRLKNSFTKARIFSEYGMTELFSQAYADESGIYHCPPWMKVLVRDEDDPLSVRSSGKGALNIIDLANMHSCSFIATEDVGEVYDDGSFKVMGRIDNSDMRGCSLLTV
jgi:hypothetical protein